MAIKSVNGKNVYVIDVEVPTPRTSTGTSYGNLVSDLRWEMFNKIQDDMLRTADIQRLGYKSQLEAYNDKVKSLRDAASRLRQQKVDLMSGGGSDEFYKTLRAENKARVDLHNSQVKAAGGGTKKTEVYPEGQKAIGPLGVEDLGKQKKETTVEPLKPSVAIPQPELLSVTGVGQTAADLDAAAKAQRDKALGWLDQEIARLEAEAEGIPLPEYTGITDFTTAGRRAFGTTMGEGGFGLQPRRGKVQPTFYQSEAIANLDKREKEAIDIEVEDTIAYREQNARDIIASNPKIRDLKMRLLEEEAMGPQADGSPTLAVLNLRKQIAEEEAAIMDSARLTPEDEATIRMNARDRMVSNYDRLGAVPVTRRQFLSPYREPSIDTGMGREPRVREPRDRSFKGRTHLNPPGTDRPDTYFAGPRGVGAPGEAEIPGPESIPRNREVIDIPGAGPYSESGAKGALPSRGMTRDTGIKYRTPQKTPDVSSTYDPTDDEFQGDLGPQFGTPEYFDLSQSPDKNVIAAEDMANAIAAEEDAAIYGESNAASRRAAAQREAEFRALLGEDYQQMPRPASARSSFGRMQPSPSAQMPIESRGGEVVPAWRRPAGLADRLALRKLAKDEQAASAPIQNARKMGGGRSDLDGADNMPEDFGTPGYFEGYTPPSEEDINIKREKPITSEPANQSKAMPTKDSRRDLYLKRVIKNGIKLSEQPSKVERLAKTSLDPRDRDQKAPKYIVIVDKLYEVNRGKPDVIVKTFNEINRVFAADPETRTKASEYLIAKDMLEQDSKKPIA